MEVRRVLTNDLLRSFKVVCFDVHHRHVALATVDNRLVHGQVDKVLYERATSGSMVRLAVGRVASRSLVVTADPIGHITCISTLDHDDDLDEDKEKVDEDVSVFDVLLGHTITQLHFDHFNTRLYVATRSGSVALFDLTGETSVSRILELGSPIVQLSTDQALLVVSTDSNTFVCDNEKKTFRQIGDKPTQGNFGSLILNQKVFCARPSCRLWQCDSSGSIERVLELRSVLDSLSPALKLDMTTSMQKRLDAYFPLTKPNVTWHSLGKLYNLQLKGNVCNMLVTYNATNVYAIDPWDHRRSMLLMTLKSGVQDLQTTRNLVWVLSRSGELVVVKVSTLDEAEEKDNESKNLQMTMLTTTKMDMPTASSISSDSSLWSKSQQLMSSMRSTLESSTDHIVERGVTVKTRTQSLLQRTGDSLYWRADQLLDFNRLEIRLKTQETKTRLMEVVEFILSFDLEVSLVDVQLKEGIRICLQVYHQLGLLTEWSLIEVLESTQKSLLLELLHFLLRHVDHLEDVLQIDDARVLDVAMDVDLHVSHSDCDWRCRSLLITFESLLTHSDDLGLLLGLVDRPFVNTWVWLVFRLKENLERQLMKRCVAVTEREDIFEELITFHILDRIKSDRASDTADDVDPARGDDRRRLRGKVLGLSVLLLELVGSNRAMTLLRQQATLIDAQDVYLVHLVIERLEQRSVANYSSLTMRVQENLFVETMAKVADLHPFTTERYLSSNCTLKTMLVGNMEKWMKDKEQEISLLNSLNISEMRSMHHLFRLLANDMELSKRIELSKKLHDWKDYEQTLRLLSKEELLHKEMDTLLRLPNALHLLRTLALTQQLDTCIALIERMANTNEEINVTWDEVGTLIIKQQGRMQAGLEVLQCVAKHMPIDSLTNNFYLRLIRERLRRRYRDRREGQQP